MGGRGSGSSLGGGASLRNLKAQEKRYARCKNKWKNIRKFFWRSHKKRNHYLNVQK